MTDRVLTNIPETKLAGHEGHAQKPEAVAGNAKVAWRRVRVRDRQLPSGLDLG